jgi:hypothetical protein
VRSRTNAEKRENMPVTDKSFNPSGKPEVDAIKTAGLALENVIRSHSPVCRRQTRALNKLEEMLMLAVKAAIMGDDN